MAERNYEAEAVGELQWIRFLLVLVVVLLGLGCFLLWRILEALTP